MLSEQSLALIATEVAKYPAEQKRSAVMGALRIAQVEKGWVSPEVMAEVAVILDMPPVAVQEVATFYNMYDLKPVGMFTLKEGDCMGACGDAPVLLHNNHTMCSFMSTAKIDELLQELAK